MSLHLTLRLTGIKVRLTRKSKEYRDGFAKGQLALCRKLEKELSRSIEETREADARLEQLRARHKELRRQTEEVVRLTTLISAST